MQVREVELEGHIIDSLILTKIFDAIMDMEGDFEILQFDVGKHKTERSYTRILIKGEDDEHVESILTELHRLGARIPEAEEIDVGIAEGDRIAPENFYSTTNHPTHVRYNGRWLQVDDIRMDCLIVVDEDRAVCQPISHIRRGDKIVIGERGVRVIPPERPRKRSVFEFMGGTVSAERPSMIVQIVEEIFRVREGGGKTAFVVGPATIHTGAMDAMATMIADGYVDLLLAGNALAVHDIEYSLYGTSLGMDIKTGIPGGHRNHIRAISEIIKCGSIKDAVDEGVLKRGIMYECIRNDIPFVLAGSIRDDGPLPDVITDTMKAQDAMRDALRGMEMVLMMATMLHSIAVGNSLPSSTKTVYVDINPSAVIKLMDRGTAQAMGIVTDVGVFLPMLADALKRLSTKENIDQ